MDCVFCKIVNKEIRTENIVYEDEDVIIFPDRRPAAPVHLLCVPKEHIQSIIYLQDNHHKILSNIIFAAKHVAEQKNLKGYKLVFNVGREGGQVIDHLHLHLLGGWENGTGSHII